MIKCERCNKDFRDQYNLTSHQSKKNKCKFFEVKKVIQPEPEKINNVKKCYSCQFCFKTFFNTQSLTRHYNCCKSQDDPIRQLEIEAGIKPVLPECLTECRFCNKVLSSKTKLNQHQAQACTAREQYYQELLKKQEEKINPTDKCAININYIYLLQEREFIKTGEHIFKIGKSKQINNKRFNSYPKGSILLFQIICDNCDSMENELIKLFDNTFVKCKNVGNEYFQGNYHEMIKCIFNFVTDK